MSGFSLRLRASPSGGALRVSSLTAMIMVILFCATERLCAQGPKGSATSATCATEKAADPNLRAFDAPSSERTEEAVKHVWWILGIVAGSFIVVGLAYYFLSDRRSASLGIPMPSSLRPKAERGHGSTPSGELEGQEGSGEGRRNKRGKPDLDEDGKDEKGRYVI